MKQVRKIYDKTFKKKAVQLSYERTSIPELARGPGVQKITIIDEII